MTAADPSEVARRLYASLTDGDAAAIAELLDPAAVLSVPGANPVAGRYQGAAGFAQFVAACTAIVPSGARTQVIDVMGGDRHAAVYGISRATRPGWRPLENHTVHLLTVHEGKITAITIYNQNQPAVDEFWSLASIHRVNGRPGCGNDERDAPWPAMMGLSRVQQRRNNEASRKCNPLMPVRWWLPRSTSRT